MTDPSYFDFFARGQATSYDWDNPIARPRMEDVKNGKLGQLHRDVFDHHHHPESVPHYVDGLIVQEDSSRIIALDNLTDYYCNSDLPVTVPIIEAPYLTPEEVERQADCPCTFEDFFYAVTDSPFSPKNVEYDRTGGNRVTYLFGSVGSGKSFLCARIIAKILRYQTDRLGFTVVPIRICFESLARAQLFNVNELGSSFFKHLLAEIEKHTYHLHHGEVRSPHIETELTEQQIYTLISEYTLQLAKRNIRLVIIFDNIDGFHYRYSRIIFFEDKYREFLRVINRTIIKLCNIISDEARLGNCGLCCLVVARENVARDFMSNLADPDKPIFEDHRMFWLQQADHKAIIESRYKLLDVATRAIFDAGRGITGEEKASYIDALKIARERIMSSAANSAEGLGIIWGLCHHGHRSLIDFIGKLKINYYSHKEIHERLFGGNPHNLERLYITNMKKRYAQCKNHFPNIFLCDSWINPSNIENNIQCKHYHSYWLKYLILKTLLDAGEKVVTGRNIIELFVKNFGYEDRFVRICLGSLCMVNESRCIEISGSQDVPAIDRALVLTTRGFLLINGPNKSGRSFPYCFDLNYLQLVIDDFWLALPKPFVNYIFVDANLSYIYDLGRRYQAGVSIYLTKKIFAAVRFLRVLESAWTYEFRAMGESPDFQNMRPDFNLIYSNMIETVDGIINTAFSGAIRDGHHTLTSKDFVDFTKLLRSDSGYDDFFDNLWKSRCKVISAE